MKDARDPLYRRHRFLAEVIAYAVWFALLHRPPVRTRRRPLAYFYLGVLDVAGAFYSGQTLSPNGGDVML